MENIGIEAETWEILFVQLDYVTFSSRFSLSNILNPGIFMNEAPLKCQTMNSIRWTNRLKTQRSQYEMRLIVFLFSFLSLSLGLPFILILIWVFSYWCRSWIFLR